MAAERPGDRRDDITVLARGTDDENRRQLHRELFCITRERTRVVSRIKALLAMHGVVLDTARSLPIPRPAFPALAA